MLELTKTKTKHQLGDFFFHFSFLSVSLLARAIFLPLGPSCQRRGSEVHTPIRGPPMYSLPLPTFQPPSDPLPTPVPRRFYAGRIPPRPILPRVAPLRTRPREPPHPRCKPYAPFGAQVAALSQIMANKLPGEIARTRTTANPPPDRRQLLAHFLPAHSQQLAPSNSISPSATTLLSFLFPMFPGDYRVFRVISAGK